MQCVHYKLRREGGKAAVLLLDILMSRLASFEEVLKCFFPPFPFPCLPLISSWKQMCRVLVSVSLELSSLGQIYIFVWPVHL